MNKKALLKVRRGMLLQLCSIFLLLNFFTFARAAPAWKDELTSSALGSFPMLLPTQIEMQMSWKGMIQAGSVRMEFSPRDKEKLDTYLIRSSAASMGVAATIFPYKSDFWSELDPNTLRPRYFNAVKIDKAEHVTTEVHYFPDRVESKESKKILKSGTTQQTDRTFAFTPIFDVFSAMLHIRSQNLNVGDRITIVLCPFNAPYLLKIRVIAHEVHEGRDAIHLGLGMQKIDRKTLKLKPYKKLKKEASLWLSNDADRIPIELRATVFIGDVRAKLVTHKKL